MEQVIFDTKSVQTSTVIIDYLSGLYILVDAGEDPLNRSYFKVYKDKDKVIDDNLRKVARISLYEPKYISGIDLEHDTFVLSEEDKAKLVALLSEKRYSNWHQVIDSFNQEKNFLSPSNWLRFTKEVKNTLLCINSIEDVKEFFDSGDFIKRRACRLLLDTLAYKDCSEIKPHLLSAVLKRFANCIPIDLEMPDYSLL